MSDERRAFSDERLATVFLLTTDYTDYIVFFSMLSHYFSLDGHSQLRTMADGLHGFLPHAKAQRVAKKI